MIEAVIAAVRGAGRAIESLRASDDLDVRMKGAEGPSSAADRAADALLHRELLALESCGWLSEETADDPRRLSERRVWIVDPLDGTKEFLAGRPEYAVAVALVEAGTPVLSVVHHPPSNATWWAERGRGAFRDGHPIRVAESDTLLASRTELARGEFIPFQTHWRVQPQGSIALKLALVASGAAAVTLSRGEKWEWDVCAGAFLVTAAGGRASEVAGGPLRYNRAPPLLRGILAGAPRAYARAAGEVAIVLAPPRRSS
ncbi:MAG TPA: 3'(2'),5'-bisphosphate nucleotidase CysQ [Gemmatimonadales bacterium]|nr:3'(2'),5'-bisphosphate nucleotidase CysQ [Gemmatimonadales bacterium]